VSAVVLGYFVALVVTFMWHSSASVIVKLWCGRF